MQLWRICRDRWADLAFDGEGARLTGGRWNHKGDRITYTSLSLALAALELFVNLDPSEAPDDLVSLTLAVPDDASARRLTTTELPRNWRDYPAPERLKDIGSEWVRNADELLLIVPSVVVPLELNVLVNPAHPEFARCVLGPPTPFHFDPRMWK